MLCVSVTVAVLQDDVDTAAVDAGHDVEHNADDVSRPSIRCIIIDCSSMTFIDYAGMMTIQQVSAITVSNRVVLLEWDINNYVHHVSKNVPPIACYNFDTHE